MSGFRSITEIVVSSRYGAPMGRATDHDFGQAPGRIHLRRMYLDSGGYDRGGAYWGFGEPLYEAHDSDGRVTILRARSRAAAKAALREDFGEHLTFWR